MKTSSLEEVQALYDQSAAAYGKMMDAEIELPLYAETFSRLAGAIADVPGPLIDTSCGSGHMLHRYREQYDPERALVGIDLSPSMVAIAKLKLGDGAAVAVGDMRELAGVDTGSVAAVVSFFALHHLSPDDVAAAFQEWARVLVPRGLLIVAAWEGSGPIDYGASSDVVAFRYRQRDLEGWLKQSGLLIERSAAELVKEMAMDAVYLDGRKP
jgi:ubiquinone/menaquinone biosynthesis C-methylase UbiE